jgi:hypothetical protein
VFGGENQADGGPWDPRWTFEPDQASAFLGAAAGTAGDVNGDGYSDLIVGAPFYSGGQAQEGRVYVFHGSATGFAATPSWIVESNTPSALFGFAGGTAGDVNGDGFDDVIIGAPLFGNPEVNEGKVFVYLGSAAGLSATPIWTLEMNQPQGQLGITVGTAGDVNGDGFSDVIIGAPFLDNGQSDEGRAFVYLGSPTGPDASPAWSGETNQPNARFGSAVGTAGDVNADGFADIVIGADHFDNGQTDEGRALVYHGSAAGLSLTPAWSVESNQGAALFGGSAAGAGDVNGDGYGDIIVGAKDFTNDIAKEGRVFAYYGSATGLSTTASWMTESHQADSEWGAVVATAGDFNGDGYADVILGAPSFNNGSVMIGAFFVFAGSPTGLQDFSIFPLGSTQQDCRFGAMVGTAGDWDGDGFSELAVAAVRFDNGQTDEGRVFVYAGRGASLGILPTFTAEGTSAQMELGHSAADAGDVNGDGFTDVIVGAPGFDNGQTDEGRASVYLGSASGLATAPAWSVESNLVGEFLGWSVAGAGDVNGDGYADVIVGTADSDGEQERAFVYLGSPTGPATQPSWTGSTSQLDAGYGSAVAAAGDVNGDGFMDVVVGAPRFDNGQADEGRALLYAGSPAGLSLSPAWTTESNQVGALCGWAVGLAGDVNRDGFSDVLVGAPAFSNGQTAEGRAFVFLGAAGGLATSPAWTGESDQAGSFFGGAVSWASDVNGDGYSDIAVGAQNFDGLAVNCGRAYAYYGGPAGLPSLPSWTADGTDTNGQFGIALGSAGDTNGDGYSDLLVGAHSVFFFDDPFGVVKYSGSDAGLGPNSDWGAGSVIPAWRFGESVSAGDVDGDGFADAIVGAPGFDAAQTDMGKVFVYGNFHDGIARAARQARTDDSAPIQELGLSNVPSGVRLKVIGRTPAGRGQVRLQYEIEPANVAFDGAGIVDGPTSMTSMPGLGGSTVPLSVAAGSLNPGTLYHWRLRIASRSPFFPRSIWLSLPGNAMSEADVRTLGATSGLDVAEVPAAAGWLAESTPNPFGASTQIAYTLPSAGRISLAVYDVQGRMVASLVDGVVPAGRNVARWDGRGTQGRGALPAGVYFVRLDFAGHREARKIVIAR